MPAWRRTGYQPVIETVTAQDTGASLEKTITGW